MASLIFVNLAINGLSIAFYGVATLIETVTVLFAILLIPVITKRMLSKRYDRYYYILLGIIITLALVNLGLLFSDQDELEVIRIIIFEFIRLLTGFYVFFAYSNAKLILKNRRTMQVKALWRVTGMIISVAALYRILDVIYYISFTSTPISSSHPSLQDSFLVITISALLVAVITGFLSVNYPELFLLTEFQIKELEELYELVESLDQNDNYILQYSSLLSYLQSLERIFHERDE